MTLKQEALKKIASIKEEVDRLMEIHKMLLEDEFSQVPLEFKMELKKIAKKIDENL